MSPTERPHLVVLIGNGSVGKTALVNALVDRFPESFRVVRSNTTRAPRDRAMEPVRALLDDRVYDFVTAEWIAQRKQRGDLAVITERTDATYAVRRTALERAMQSTHGILHAAPDAVGDFRALGLPTVILRVRAVDRDVDPRSMERIAFDDAQNRIACHVDATITNSFANDGLYRTVDTLRHVITRFTR